LIVDSSEDAAYLPLLQVTLKDLWQRGSLKLEAYRTLADALRRRAEEIYTYVDYNGARQEKRTATDQQTLIEFFLDLVEVSLDNNARRDVRIQRRADDLHRGDTKRKQLVEDMCNARLLSKSVEIREDQPVEVVNVIHETLISHW
jgi:hypothetical protein